MKHLMCVVVCGLLVVLLVGCTEKTEQANTTAHQSMAASTAEAPGTVPAEPGAVGDGETGQQALSAGEAVVEGEGEPPAKTTADKLPPERLSSDEQLLVGEWFALFGSQEQSLMTLPEEVSHHIKFDQNGTGRIIKYANGEPSASTFIKWHVEDKDLMIQFIAAEAVGIGLNEVAPLGIARDEETGLLPLGIARDEETGLLKGETGGDAPQDQEFRRCMLNARIEENYIALRDPIQRMVIYGRLPRDGGGEVPDLSGEWVGHIDMHDNFSAAFEVQDDGTVIGTYDHDGGRFVGRFLNGYLVGKVDYGMKFSLAALKLTEDWELDGVYSPSPYVEMVSRYDFNRYSQ